MRLLEKNLTNHAKVVWMIDTTAPPPMTGNRKQTCDGTRLKPEGFNLVPQHGCQTLDQANARVWCLALRAAFPLDLRTLLGAIFKS